MKKAGSLIFLGFLILVIAINTIFAADITLKKNSLSQLETLQAEITGSFTTPINPSNVAIYSEGSVHIIPVESGLIKDDNNYYYYALAPASVGKYILKIEGVSYYQGIKEVSNPLEVNFSVYENNNTYLSIFPGYVLSSTDFDINVIARGKDQEVTVEFPPSKYKETKKVFQNYEKTFCVTITNLTNITRADIKVGSYTIPAIITPAKKPEQKNVSLLDLEDLIQYSPKEITATLTYNNAFEFPIYVRNLEGENIDFNLSVSESSMTLNKYYLEDLEDSEIITLTIKSKEAFNGTLRLFNDNSTIKIPVNIIITKNESEVNFSYNPSNSEKTCSDLGGKKCDSSKNQRCSIGEVYSLDGWCCKGECKAVSSSSSGWIWGILLLVVAGIVIWFFYKKSKENSRKEPGQIINQRTEKFKERMDQVEVRKGLEKS
jgi:hypothetical protein